MNDVIYLDVYFAWNFVMDLVTLLLAGVIASEKAALYRLCLASLFGAAFAAGILCLNAGRFVLFLAGFAAFFPMVLIAFGKRSYQRLVFLSLFAFLSSLFLGGALSALSYLLGASGGVTAGAFLSSLLFAFGGYSLWGKSLKRKLESRVISLAISNRGREEQFYALVDSGAFLREPESGAPVILLKAEFAAGLLTAEELFALRLGNGEGMIPVPVRTASGEGRLFGFFPSAVRLHRPGKRKRRAPCEKILVAIDFSGGGFAGCPCLVPLSIV